MEKQFNIGIIVGRFQVAKLHPGQLALIEEVTTQHQRVAIFLGVTQAMSTKNNPLDFLTRKLMIQERFPEIAVLAIPDMASDAVWSKELDTRIREVFPVGNPLLYGSRDSFIPSYKGNFECKELKSKSKFSGTEQRLQLSNEVRASADFRAGVIFGLANQYDKVNPTIDVAIVNIDNNDSTHNKVLLGRKSRESKFRFIGGFVDPQDNSLEETVVREAKEETGLTVQNIKYIASVRIDDWRYRKEKDKIITAFFMAETLEQNPKAQDDIADVKWFDLQTIQNEDLVEEHWALLEKLKLHVGL